MFTSKLASTLTKTVAARSSTEMAAVAAAVAAAVTATTMATSNNPDPEQHDSQCRSLRLSNNPPSAQRFFPLADTAFSRNSSKVSCEALLPQASRGGTTHRFSRLNRRRTIQRLQESKTQANLDSMYIVDKRPLGEGAFGAVFVGRHRQTLEHVAVKKIPKQLTSDANFQCEMDALMHIRAMGGHPNICALRQNFEEGAYYYLVLDLVSGGEMFDHLCRQGPYSEADAARLVREVASALAFCHGIGLVHGDLKPENLMLSSENPLHAVIKVVDFGCAQVTKEQEERLEGESTREQDAEESILHAKNTIANTPAYCPPEILDKELRKRRGMAHYNKLDPAFDMWALGVILYIMLTGVHPFDLDGTATDEDVERKIVGRQAPPLRNSEYTEHLSESAISLIEQLMQWEPTKRLSAQQMLEHPWVRGVTALKRKIADSDTKLSTYKAYKSKLEAKVFLDLVQWADEGNAQQHKDTSLLERAYHNLDESKRGFISTNDLRRLSGHKTADNSTETSRRTQATSACAEADDTIDYSAFSQLLSDNMKDRYFPKGHVVYREGDRGDQMYFINSGTIQVSTSDGHLSTRSQGDTFGEGALLHESRRNTSTIKCVTPVHAIEISRSYFDKFLNNGDVEQAKFAKIHLNEKDKTRKRERAKRLLRSQSQQAIRELKGGEHLFDFGEKGKDLFILEDGIADVVVENGKVVFSLAPGDMCGDHVLHIERPRNTSTICVSPGGCKFRMVNDKEYTQIVNKGAWWVKESLRDISLRREFQKAIVMKTGQSFPYTDETALRRVFDIADTNHSGKLELDNIREMLLSFDKSFTDADVKEILDALDLDESGVVSFEEFKRMFLFSEGRQEA